MGSLSIPVIDFSKEKLNPGSSSWIQMQKEVCSALEEFGCFHAHYDVVPLEDHKKIYGRLEDWFNLPKETKLKNRVSKEDIVGYSVFAGGERLGIKDDDPFFCGTVYSYKHEIVKLNQIVKRMVLESFGLEEYYESFIESTQYFLGADIYPRHMNANATSTPTVEHTDAGFLTILHQNDVNGLQIKTKDGQWISHTPSPTSYMVMVGDSLVAWSNGRYHSPVHWVALGGTATRYSVILMSYTIGIIEAPKELIDDEHPSLFKPFHLMDLVRVAYSRELPGNRGAVWVHFAR